MTFNQKIFAVSVAVVFFVIVIDLARRRKLRVEYSILWAVVAVVILALALWYDLLLAITRLIGAVVPTTTLFICGVMFLLFLNLYFSVRVSQLSEQLKNLTQEIALYLANQKSKEKEKAP
jgi:hypothetical protein